MPTKENGPKQSARRSMLMVLAALLLSEPISVEGPVAQKAAKPEPTPQCLSYERTNSCGCGLKITRLKCAENRPDLHFHSELHQGAPLWVNIDGRELSLRSRLPQINSFNYGEGDRWREEYDGDNVNVRIQYRPAKSSCPKKNDPDGCEYFDVAADVTVTVDAGRPRTYKAVGACGC
jgi:hypothetical protein